MNPNSKAMEFPQFGANPSPNDEIKSGRCLPEGLVVVCKLQRRRSHHLMLEGSAGLMSWWPCACCTGRWLGSLVRWSLSEHATVLDLTPFAVAAIRGRPRTQLRCGDAPASAARRGLAQAAAARDSGERSSPASPSPLCCGWRCRRFSSLSRQSPLRVGGERGSGERDEWLGFCGRLWAAAVLPTAIACSGWAAGLFQLRPGQVTAQVAGLILRGSGGASWASVNFSG
jgi:hypothetical protein